MGFVPSLRISLRTRRLIFTLLAFSAALIYSICSTHYVKYSHQKIIFVKKFFVLNLFVSITLKQIP